MDSSQLSADTPDKKWWIHPTEGKLLFTINDPGDDEQVCRPIIKFEHGPQVGSITVSLQMDRGLVKKLDVPLKAFDTSANELCHSFKDKTFSRTRFIEEFNQQSSKISSWNKTAHNSTNHGSTSEVLLPCTNTQDCSSASMGTSFTFDSENQDCSPPVLHTFKVADSFKVKIDLLNAPSLISQVRIVDEGHSQKLQKEMEKNPDCQYFKLLVHIPGVLAANVAQDKINSGSYNLEVIGGNHTRIALQSMKDAKKEFVDATVYAGLNPIQALSLGIKHNDTHSHAKAMSFHDYVNLFRKVWCNTISDLDNPTRKERSQMNANLANMLRLSKLEVSRKFRHHLYLATLPPNIWDKANRFMSMWQDGKILGQPKKPLTQFTMLTLEKPDKNEFGDIVDKLCAKEKTWSQLRRPAMKKSKNCSVSEEVKDLTEELRQVKAERDQLKRKLVELEREVTALKSQKLPQPEIMTNTFDKGDWVAVMYSAKCFLGRIEGPSDKSLEGCLDIMFLQNKLKGKLNKKDVQQVQPKYIIQKVQSVSEKDGVYSLSQHTAEQLQRSFDLYKERFNVKK